MAQAVVKLFRNPQSAAKAAKELKSQGFKAAEIGILACDKTAAKKVGAKATKDIGSALAKLDLNDDAIKYYELGCSLGGVLLSVNADEKRLSQAQEIMRKADFGDAPMKWDAWSSSPAFPAAGRMSASNPLDAKMSGDFRKY